ncbi:MAG TPA: extracellular solute-binding protein [Miltoncostaeaceae bacterium]|nr:extracellular solute-binding protein [Miltoncostaeaceae bacterium]
MVPIRQRARWRGRVVALAASAVAAAGLLTACGGGGGPPELTWYINPDPNPPDGFEGPFGQAGIADRCSTDEYTIRTELLPQSATEQRIQLLRRLVAKDSSISLMSLDPVFTAEFAEAGFLEPLPEDLATELERGTLKGALQGATWNDQLVAAPLWANTQTLWYRKSLAKKAGLDMTKPVTWDQIIDAASENDATVGVQANKYEGYVVWINALVEGAGGSIVTDTEKGPDATVDIGGPAGRDAAEVISKLASSPAAEPDLSVSNEGTVLGPMSGPKGGFMVNWTFAYNNFQDSDVADDIGYARYPETVAGEQSRPPIGGINVGVSPYGSHVDLAMDAVRCITSEKEQVRYAIETANMPARQAAYDDAELRKQFPADLLELWQQSIDTGGPRPASPYWATIVNATLNKWHPADSVNPDSTPQSSADFIRDALQGKVLL